MTPPLSAFLPLKTSGERWRYDLTRAELLVDSLDRFADRDLLSVIRVATPKNEVEMVRKALVPRSKFPVEVVSEEDLEPAISRYTGRVNPWKTQQILKLAAVAAAPTRFVLVFDADLICSHPTRLDDLIVHGKALYDTEKMSIRSNWHRASADLLGVELQTSEFAISVTPQILARDICQELTKRLSEVHGINWAEKLSRVHDPLSLSFYTPKARLHRQWTEYSLYHQYAKFSGLLDTFHVASSSSEAPQRILSRNSVWRATPVETWNPSACFGPDDNSHFVLFQSNKLVEPSVIRSLVDSHLQSG